MTAPTPPAVSPRAQQALREAMTRLFNGKPLHTDGKLTKNNLWREARVSRATMNRASEVLTEWDSRLAVEPSAQELEHDKELSRLRGKLKESRHERQQLQDKVDAAATVIAVLLAENTALREQALARSAAVIPLGRAHATRN